jgi:hypothetical protein
MPSHLFLQLHWRSNALMTNFACCIIKLDDTINNPNPRL